MLELFHITDNDRNVLYYAIYIDESVQGSLGSVKPADKGKLHLNVREVDCTIKPV